MVGSNEKFWYDTRLVLMVGFWSYVLLQQMGYIAPTRSLIPISYMSLFSKMVEK